MYALSSKTSCGNLVDHALDYAARGWCVIPVTGKRAAGLWKPFQRRAPDVETLHRLFAKSGVTGLAVVTGAVSGGLAVRDYDRADAYHTWAEAHPADASRLPTVRSARGYHVYGRLDAEDYRTLADGELRADSGHYILLPPSLHPDGITYGWTIPLPEGELPSLPPSILTNYAETYDPADSPHVSRSCSSTQTQESTAWWTSAISATLPCGPGRRNRCIFELARRLKALKPGASPAELRPILREWHAQALPHVRTKDFTESWTDFAVAWERIRRPVGQSFRAAAEAAASGELPAIAEQFGYDGHLRRLAALCWQLALQWGQKSFPLGCKIVGQYLGISTRHAGRLLKALQFDGVIDLVSKGSKQSGKASEYRLVEEKGQGG